MTIGIAAVIVHYFWFDGRKTIEFGAAVIGGGAAVYALLLNVQTRRAAAAAEFIKRYNSPDFAVYRTEMGRALQLGKVDAVNLEYIRTALSFYKEMSISIRRNEADEDILKEFFHTPAVRFWAVSRRWIQQRRDANDQQSLYEWYEELATKRGWDCTS